MDDFWKIQIQTAWVKKNIKVIGLKFLWRRIKKNIRKFKKSIENEFKDLKEKLKYY